MKRKLGQPAPDVLKLVDGVIVMKNGGNTVKYLGNWQEACEIENHTDICVVTRESLESLESRLAFFLGMTFC